MVRDRVSQKKKRGSRKNNSHLVRRAMGATLRALREQAGISQETLALEAGVDRSYVSGLERGRHFPTFKIFFRLLPVLGVKPAGFIRELEKRMARLAR